MNSNHSASSRVLPDGRADTGNSIPDQFLVTFSGSAFRFVLSTERFGEISEEYGKTLVNMRVRRSRSF